MHSKIKETITHNKKNYIDQKLLVEKYLGYKKEPNNLFEGLYSVLYLDSKRYIALEDALELIKTKYNTRNPHIINIHNKLKIKGKEYTVEAQTLNRIINYLDKNNIASEVQYVDISNQGIDVYIPQYKIAITCHKIDNTLIKGIEIFYYNPYQKKFNIDNIILDLQEVIDRKKINDMCLENIFELSRENSLEYKYYKLVGQSLITNGFVVNLHNVRKICGFKKRSDAKICLINNFDENVDYIISPSNNPNHIQKIILTVDCFKMFCMIAPTEEAKQIRLEYIKIESAYERALVNAMSILQTLS